LGVFLFLELLEQPYLVEVLHAEHSKSSGSGLSGSLSYREGVLKMATTNAKNGSAKNSTAINSSSGTSAGLSNKE